MTDLREFLKGTEKLGELKTVRNADWNLEVGAITEIPAAEPNPPALLFDKIKDYPRDFGHFSEHVSNPVAHGVVALLADDSKGVELVRAVKDILKTVATVPPVLREADRSRKTFSPVRTPDVLKFPAPKLHREDGGRYSARPTQ